MYSGPVSAPVPLRCCARPSPACITGCVCMQAVSMPSVDRTLASIPGRHAEVLTYMRRYDEEPARDGKTHGPSADAAWPDRGGSAGDTARRDDQRRKGGACQKEKGAHAAARDVYVFDQIATLRLTLTVSMERQKRDQAGTYEPQHLNYCGQRQICP